jgi:SEC-C motif-containing protein
MRLTNDYPTDDYPAATRKLGRNDRCWCGSGNKYKVCHLDREKQTPTRPWEGDAAIHASDKSSECLHVGTGVGNVCGEPAINSHTVPRKMLKQIARDGHVYCHSGSVQDLEKNQGRLSVKSIGVNDASALRVFCRTHDNDVFTPLEQGPFVGSQVQCFLLAYRSICHEFFRKRRALRATAAMKDFDRGKSLPQQVHMQTAFAEHAFGQCLGMRDILEQKQHFDSMQAGKDYSDIRGFVVTFENVPDVLCSSAIAPECDFGGQQLQDMADFSHKLELMTFSLIATDNGGAFVFAWHSDGDAACRPLATSLAKLNDHDLPHAILRLIFEYCENHYLRPEWWDKLDEKVRRAITDRSQRGSSPDEERLADCLVDDGIRAVSWKVAARTWTPTPCA